MKPSLRSLLLLLLTAISCWFLGYKIEQYAHSSPNVERYVQELELEIKKAEYAINDIFNNASFLMQATAREIIQDSIIKYKDKPYTILIYNDNDSLLYWSNNRISPYSSDIRFSTEKVQRLNNTGGSQYLMIKQPYEIIINKVKYRYSLIGLIPLYLHYPISNGYLNNHFPLMPKTFSQYVLPSKNAAEDKEGISIVNDSKGNALLELKPKSIYPYRNFVIWGFFLYLTSGLLLLLLLYKTAAIVSREKGLVVGLLTFITTIVVLRTFMIYVAFPQAALTLDLFQLQFSIHNNSWFYSLGDFLIDMGIFLAIAVFIVQQWTYKEVYRWSSIQKYFFAFTTYSFIVGGFSFIQLVLKDVVFNPNIYFEFEDFSKLDLSSVTALSGIVILFVSFFLISNKIYRLLSPLRFAYTTQLAIGGGVILTTVLVHALLQYPLFNILYISLFSIAFSLLLAWFVGQKQLTFIWLSGWLLFFATLSTILLEQANIEKSRFLHEEFLKTITNEQDSRVEDAFFRLGPAIQEDDFFKVYFSSMYIPYNQAVERLTYLYLDNEFFGRYQYKIHAYSANGAAKKASHLPYNELKYLLDKADSTTNDFLYFLSHPMGRYSYFAHIPILQKDNILGYIVIELTPKKESEKTSIYVELLSLSQSKLEKKFESLHYALYKNNQRVAHRSGEFPAFWSYEYSIPKPNNFLIQKRDGIPYLVYRDHRDYVALVELSKASWLKPLSVFSYLFCSGILTIFMISIILLIARRLFKVDSTNFQFQSSLREKIQQGIIVVSLLSFVAIGVITIIYFQNEYTDYHKSRLKRKIGNTAKTATWQIINSQDSVLQIPNAKDLANIHKIDVNVYNLDGKLLSTSEDAVFERKLLSEQMHPMAYYKMRYEQRPRFSHSEQINNFEYLSGYVPLKNKQGSTIAFLNLPYDLAGSKNIRSQDVAEFLGALLNVYVIFLLLAGFVAFLIASSVTRPLSVIGEKLRQIKIGKKNDLIVWESKDEIGDFIARFNDMIQALEKSTQELARSQRESAWRDMAKQVAHEIKNPLTPIKLQIQMLERAADKNPEKAQKMMKRVAKTLVEQIDNLAHIASEFSNFAKMPTTKNEYFLLNPMIEGVYTLFMEEENVQLRLDMTSTDLKVWADKSQILRVLNNLVKNAIQAIPDDRPGIIDIKLYMENNKAIIKVSDNGIGIPEEKKENIFTPYFTTKSSGTGIGLAMSKNIVELAKGNIYFQSVVNKGTDFFVELPIYEKI